MTPCTVCQVPARRRCHGRCQTCANYWRLYGRDRDALLVRGSQRRAGLIPNTCVRCGVERPRLPRQLRLERCDTCYAWLRRTGADRPLFEREHLDLAERRGAA